ncbi:ankyrin repeat-containing domain protein [Parachaetomium inaequale]|uniref:Ankyrin repeat-containing domain protein n=1 Tax=Parachaetomium inaequale TaxID=2588326 RepID=A0AAN6SRX3_9PEZI|nr:ankyrin repeat-containing domain protein [Parachaetomium inaequale]
MGLRKLKEKLGFRGSAKASDGGSAVQQASAVSSNEASKPTPPSSDPPIRELWNIAYEKLREEDDALVLDYEKKLCGDLGAGLGALAGANAMSRREQMAGILHRKMDEINRETWKLRFGKAGEVAVKDLAEPVLGVISRANEYIAGALASNPYASMAWTGVALLLPLLLNPSEQAAALANGLEHISSLVSQSRMWEELYDRRYESQTAAEPGEQPAPASLSHSEYKNALEMLYRQILKFQVTSYCYFASKSAFRLGLDVRESVFAAISAIWRDMKYDEECAAADERHQETMLRWDAIGADVTGLRRAVEDAQRERKRADLLDWLCDIDPSEMYNTARDRHEEGTGDWLIRDNEKFQLWEEQPSSLLWLHGKAGCGKSILISTVIKHLRERHSSDPRTALVYFYFSFSDVKKQNVVGLLASLIKQLCARRPILPQQMENLYEYKERGERPDAKTLELILMAAMGGFSAVHIIIDALDECPALSAGGERKMLLQTIRRIATAAPANLHMLCTSRKELDINGVLSPLLSAAPWGDAIDLTAAEDVLDHDIGLYIDSIFASDDFESWPDHVKSEARELLIERADGMFQYVAQQFNALRDLSSEALIRKALHELPVGLDATYDRLLQSIDPKFQPQLVSLLKWLAFSNKILGLEELADIFVLRPERTVAIDEAERLFNPRDVLKYLSSLVVTQDGWENYRHPVTRVRLAHFSIKEYLTSGRITQGPAARFAFSDADAHLHIAHSCLAYHLQYSATYTDAILYKEEGLQLGPYAALDWPVHLEMVESPPLEVASAAARALKAGSQSLYYTLWMNLKRINWVCGDELANLMLRCPLCFTAGFGFVRLTGMLVSSHEYLTQEDLDAALVCAAKAGRIAAMELLLDRGADIDTGYGKFGSPLQAAALGNQPHAIEFLVRRGANVNPPPSHAGSVLTLTMDRDAVWLHGHHKAPLQCLSILLDSGADINMDGDIGNDNGTPLHAAAQKLGKTREQCHLLIERGADVNTYGGKYGFPLQALCANSPRNLRSNPRVEIELLLDMGADINARGGKYGSALQCACFHRGSYVDGDIDNSSSIIELLLDRGADPNTRGGYYETALQAVCTGNWFRKRQSVCDLVSLLLERGADIHAQGGYYGNTLQASCEDGNLEVAKLLLDRGADPNARGGYYGTALQAACTPFDTMAVVNLLIERGADIHAQGGYYGNALQASCSHDNFEVAKRLLDLGADVNASGGKYGNALQAAAAVFLRLRDSDDEDDDQTDMLGLLLSRGADVNQPGGRYGTALQAAANNRNPGSVRLLLAHGADINAEGGEYGTALQAACEDGRRMEIASLLLERGADVHAQGGRYGSAWHAAAAHRGEEWEPLLQKMLDRGVDINDARGRQHATALGATLEVEEWWEADRARLRFLIDRGADVNIQAGEYGSALQSACSRMIEVGAGAITDTINAVKILLDNCPDMDVNAQGGKFGTALQAAAYCGQVWSAELLLRSGADANLRGGKYGSALNAAVVGGWWNIADVLLAAGATPDCWLRPEPDEKWLARVCEEEGRGAVERYRVFWKKQKEKKGQASE